MNKKISLLLPTRGRPSLVRRLFQSVIDHTADLENLEIIMYLDEDDSGSHRIEDQRLNIVRIIGPHTTMGGYNTKCLDCSSGEIIILMNDDLIICTPKWDQVILDFTQSIADGIFLAYPDDMEKGNLSTFPIMSRKTCEVLSRPFPEQYVDLFIDNHIFDIFIRLKYLGEDRMFYLDKVKLDHRHFVKGKVRPDASYIHKNRYKDTLTFISLRHMRQVSARRLLAAIEGMPLPSLPNDLVLEQPSANLAHTFVRYFSVCLTDYGLPLSRRLLWFVRLTKYHAAMKSGLHFLKRMSYTLYGSG